MTDIVLPEMLTQTFDQFKDPVAIASTDSRFIYANLSVAKLAGFRTPDGMRDKYYEEVQSTLFEDAEVIKKLENTGSAYC